MAVLVDGKEFLVQALNTATGLTLKATYSVDGGAPVTASQSVAYASPVQASGNAYSEITANVTFTFLALTEVTKISLFDGTTELASETLTTDNTFPNGGDLIVRSYKITVA